MSEAPKIVRTPHAFYRKMRESGYRSWLSAFPRELFQNAIDAKSNRIDITVGSHPARETFGARSDEDVVRVDFNDDGLGISEETFRDIFFSLGSSTKGNEGDGVGGFGTARLMLCFSQDSYRILSGDLYVRGRGEMYEILKLSDVRKDLMAASGSSDFAKAAAAREELASLPTSRVKGTKFSIDISKSDVRSPDAVVDAFKEYVARSQIGPVIRLNNERLEVTPQRRRQRKELYTNLDGKEVKFAKVYTSSSANAAFKGEVLVRVAGTLMYSRRAYGMDEQVIVEIDPKLSRQVLTQDREGLKGDADQRLSAFISRLIEDKENALRETERSKMSIIKGGRGVLRSDTDLSFKFTSSVELNEDAIPADADIPESVRQAFIADITNDAPTFVDGYANPGEVYAFKEDCKARGWAALADAPDNLRIYLMGGLGQALRESAKRTDERRELASKDKFNDMNNVHIMIDDIKDEDKLKVSARQFSPDYWVMLGDERRAPRGRGMEAHKLLMAWTVSCQTAFQALASVAKLEDNKLRFGREKMDRFERPVEFGAGYYFTKARSGWDNGEYKPVATVPSHIDTDVDGNPVLLLNPVGLDTKIAFDISKDNAQEARGSLSGLSELENLAVSDVCRLVTGGYNRDFSELYMRALSLFNRERNRSSIEEGSKAVLAAYGKGETLMQPEMIDGPQEAGQEVRPGEKLLAHAAPSVLAVAGVAAENIDLVGAELAKKLDDALPVTVDGVRSVNCDALQSFEDQLNVMSTQKWDPEVIIQNVDVPAATPKVLDIVPPAEPVGVPVPVETEEPALDLNELAVLQSMGDKLFIEETSLTRPAVDNLHHVQEKLPAPLDNAPKETGVFLSLDDAMLDAIEGGDTLEPDVAASAFPDDDIDFSLAGVDLEGVFEALEDIPPELDDIGMGPEDESSEVELRKEFIPVGADFNFELDDLEIAALQGVELDSFDGHEMGDLDHIMSTLDGKHAAPAVPESGNEKEAAPMEEPASAPDVDSRVGFDVTEILKLEDTAIEPEEMNEHFPISAFRL